MSSLKSKVDKLDVDKLTTFPFDLSKLSNVVNNDVITKDVYNTDTKYKMLKKIQIQNTRC